jgi:hypothetical protein
MVFTLLLEGTRRAKLAAKRGYQKSFYSLIPNTIDDFSLL